MPTENRSSNTEMVSVPREHELKILPQPFDDLLSGAKTGEVRDRRDREFNVGDSVSLVEISGLGIEHGPTGRTMCRTITHIQTGFGLPDNLCVLSYGQPAQQHQGEPVALVIPDECPHIIVFDDADRANEHFCGAGARPAALRRYEQISQSWNAHLFVRVARNSRDDGYPSATVADPAEVERLREGISKHWKVVCDQRAEIERLSRKAANADLALAAQTRQVHTLRAQLAELVSAVRSINYGPAHVVLRVPGDDEPCYPQRKEWIEWLFGLCDSASAEPSEPVEIDHDALVAAACVLRSQGLDNLSAAVEEARAALERKL